LTTIQLNFLDCRTNHPLPLLTEAPQPVLELFGTYNIGNIHENFMCFRFKENHALKADYLTLQ